MGKHVDSATPQHRSFGAPGTWVGSGRRRKAQHLFCPWPRETLILLPSVEIEALSLALVFTRILFFGVVSPLLCSLPTPSPIASRFVARIWEWQHDLPPRVCWNGRCRPRPSSRCDACRRRLPSGRWLSWELPVVSVSLSDSWWSLTPWWPIFPCTILPVRQVWPAISATSTPVLMWVLHSCLVLVCDVRVLQWPFWFFSPDLFVSLRIVVLIGRWRTVVVGLRCVLL